MKKETVLVLGATGNLGAYSALALDEAGYSVIASGKRASDNGFFTDRGMEYVSIDITAPGCIVKKRGMSAAGMAGIPRLRS